MLAYIRIVHNLRDKHHMGRNDPDGGVRKAPHDEWIVNDPGSGGGDFHIFLIKRNIAHSPISFYQ